MPGHKGKISLLGVEDLDITEIDGADELWSPEGIIYESEANASSLFGCPTLYSTEGSSLCIRGMLFLAKKWARIHNTAPLILAGRNAHRTFVYASAVLELGVEWLMPKDNDSYQACSINANDIDSYLSSEENAKPTAVYLTSPDYLGNILDIKSIASICHKHGILLLVDNAHGAYLKFMKPSMHPIDLGADLCCDSAHKTLPALTGAAYLHISPNADSFFKENARTSMAMFGSTSPSYLILQSLDLCNLYLSENTNNFALFSEKIKQLKERLFKAGYSLSGDEPLKITIDAKSYGYNGNEFAEILKNNNIYVEYHDDDYVVMMFSLCNTDSDIIIVSDVLEKICAKEPLSKTCFNIKSSDQKMSFSSAIMADSETVPSENAIGRILADPVVSTPPCVPLYMCGEEIESVIPTENVRVIKD